jgi:hypothetical protein
MQASDGEASPKPLRGVGRDTDAPGLPQDDPHATHQAAMTGSRILEWKDHLVPPEQANVPGHRDADVDDGRRILLRAGARRVHCKGREREGSNGKYTWQSWHSAR